MASNTAEAVHPTTDLIVSTKADNATSKQIWSEPLDTKGLVPRNLKRAATTQYPILEIFQRLLYRIKSNSGDLEKVLALIGLYQAVKPICGYVKDAFMYAFTVQVTVYDSDPIAKNVMAWMGSEVITARYTRSAMLVTRRHEDPNEEFQRRMMMPLPEDDMDAQVLCLPPIGTRLFWIGYRPFLFSRRGGTVTDPSVGRQNVFDRSRRLSNSLTILTPGWSLQPLHDFTKRCRDFKDRNQTSKMTVYFAGGSSNDPYGRKWSSVIKATRKLDTIDMDQDTKTDVIRDAEYYYSDQSRQLFADCGIPYRRGYLFYGPPGTGKSSFSTALAGHLACDLYHINLSTGDINDGDLHRLFLSLPRKCVVVIEDIDSAGIGRENSKENSNTTQAPRNASPHASSGHHRGSHRGGVTLSGLLNAIDGNASQEGRLLIMTSNHPDALDPALTRPGRIDKNIFFGNMNKSASRSIFKRLIGRSALAHDAAFTMAQIDAYAELFAERLPENTFSPAQVQNFLQTCRGDPIKALADFDTWALEENRRLSATETKLAGGEKADSPVVGNDSIEDVGSDKDGGSDEDADADLPGDVTEADNVGEGAVDAAMA